MDLLKGLSGVRTVGAGIDTLVLFSTKRLNGEKVADLHEAREKASTLADGEPGPEVVIAGQGLRVRPYALKKAALIAESELFALAVAPRAAEPFPTVTVEIRALALWSLGYEAAAARAVAMLAEMTIEPAQPQVSRCDLTVDFQGWIPAAPLPGERRRFVCRPRGRGRYFEPVDRKRSIVDRDADKVRQLERQVEFLQSEIEEMTNQLKTSEFDEGREFSGFTFGRGGIVSARLYDKTRELKRSRKEWFHKVWAKAPGFVPDRPVWRLEYQLRRDALRQFVGLESNVRQDLGSWAALKEKLRSVWSYLTRGWLRYDEGRTAKERKRLTPQWADLSEVKFQQEPTEGLYRKKLENQGRPVLAALAGYLASGVGQLWALGDKRTCDELIAQLVADCLAYAAEKHVAAKSTTAVHALTGEVLPCSSMAEKPPRTVAVVARERADFFKTTLRVVERQKLAELAVAAEVGEDDLRAEINVDSWGRRWPTKQEEREWRAAAEALRVAGASRLEVLAALQ